MVKSKEEIIKKRDFLRSLMTSDDIKDELIVNTATLAKIRIKINMLNWVLEEDLND